MSRVIHSAARSAIIKTGELVLPEVMVGMIEASAMRRPASPRRRNLGSTTALSSASIDFGLGAFGAVCLFAGYWLLTSLWPRYQLIRQQASGVSQRYGIFLIGDLLVSHSWFDTTIIPATAFRGLRDSAVAYEFNGQTKSFTLPEIIGAGRPRLGEAIRRWSGTSS